MTGKFEIYKDKGGEFRFRLNASNGESILTSEGYQTQASCLNGVESVKKNATNDAHFERKQASSGKYMFNLKATNGQVIGTSHPYEAEAARNQGILSVKEDAPGASVVDSVA